MSDDAPASAAPVAAEPVAEIVPAVQATPSADAEEDEPVSFAPPRPAIVTHMTDADVEKLRKCIDNQDETSVLLKEHGVNLRRFHAFVKKEHEEEESCVQLPLSVLLVIVYAVFLAIVDPHRGIFDTEFSIKFDIEENANFAFTGPMGHKGVQDVNSISDFWSWSRLGFLPLVLSSGYGYSESRPAVTGLPAIPTSFMPDQRLTGTYLTYNRLVGGVVLRRQVAEGKPCEQLTDAIANQLYPGVQAQCYKDYGFELPPEAPYVRDFNKPSFYDTASDSVYFAAKDGVDAAVAKAEFLENSGWYNIAAEKLQYQLVVHNRQHNIYTVVSVNFQLSRSGHIWKTVTTDSMRADTSPGSGEIATTIIFALLLLKVAVAEILEVIRETKSEGLGVLSPFNKSADAYWTVWNVVDWVSIVWAAVMFGYFASVFSNASTLDSALASVNVSDEIQTRAWLGKLLGNLDAWFTFRVLLEFYPLVIMLRLFKAYSAQARLALVTRTLARASVDMIHFGIVFLSVLFSFMLCAQGLFGRKNPDFSDVGRSFLTCFRALNGDFDWDAMEESGLIETGVFLFLFIILLIWVMLNMLLAIIMDTYSAVKAQAEKSDTLWGQGSDTFRRRLQKYQKKRLGLMRVAEDLERHIESTHADDDTVLTYDMFKQACPTIKDGQIDRLTHLAVQEEISHSHDELTLTDAIKLIGRVDKKTSRMEKVLLEVMKQNQELRSRM